MIENADAEPKVMGDQLYHVLLQEHNTSYLPLINFVIHRWTS